MKVKKAEKGVSFLLEYLLLIGILSVFVVVTSLYLKDTLENSQLERVLENQATDTASVIASQITDYILLSESASSISSKIPMVRDVGGVELSAELVSSGGKTYVIVKDESGEEISKIPLGEEKTFNFKVINSSVQSLEEEKTLTFNKSVVCEVPILVSLDVSPGGVRFTTSLSDEVVNHTITIRKQENGNPIEANWTLYLWNGSVYRGYGDATLLQMRYTWPGDSVSDWSGMDCVYHPTNKTAICNVTIRAWLRDSPQCNDTDIARVLLSKKPENIEPFLDYRKFAKPSTIGVGDIAEIHIVLEGRGFQKEQMDLSVVQVLDTSGSMEDESEYMSVDDSVTVKYWSKEFEIDSSDVGKILHIRVWTMDSDITNLTGWYPVTCVDVCTPLEYLFGLCSPPWSCQQYSRYKHEYVRLYLDGVEMGNALGTSDTEPYGKDYTKTITTSDVGNHTIMVVARAPEPITLHMLVEIGSDKIIDNSTSYNSTLIVHEINLPYGRTQNNKYEYLEVNTNTKLFDAWLEDTSGNKEMFDQDKNSVWINDSNVPAGGYRVYAVPTELSSSFFTAKAYISKLDAAKIASIYFNNLEGVKYVGLAEFNWDGTSYQLNSSSSILKYLTTDKNAATNVIKSLGHDGATDHYDGLYAGYIEFPDQSTPGNNCTECLNDTIPLIILLSDGETTTCDYVCKYSWYEPCWYKCRYCNGQDFCDAGAEKARYIANIIKNTEVIPGEEYSKIKICTIGFGTSLSSNGQDLLRDIASTRPDNGQPCYFFARGYEELSEAFEAIYKAFKIAAKNITVVDTVNDSITINPNLQYIPGSLKIYLNGEDKTSEFNYTVTSTPQGTQINVTINGIAIEDKLEIVFKVKPLREGVYSLNVPGVSYITYERYPFGSSNRVTEPLGSALLVVTSGEESEVRLG